jgi:hypothetical protein
MEADRTYRKLVGEGRDALERRQWDRARQLLTQARKVRDTGEVQDLLRRTEAKE